jgi:hypothetical protein
MYVPFPQSGLEVPFLRLLGKPLSSHDLRSTEPLRIVDRLQVVALNPQLWLVFHDVVQN